MAILTVGATSSYPTIAAAMLAAAPGDTIQLESGYSNETATVTHEGITIFGDATSTGIVIQIGAGVATFTLTGDAPINVFDAVDGEGIVGNAGDNVITVASGSDAVDGGSGTDRLVVDYRGAIGAVTGDSTSNFTEAGGGGRMVTITDGTFEHFTILTGPGADTITTGAGDDFINVGDGANTVTAGQGANVIIGGSDADTFTALDGGNVMHGGDGANVLTSGDGADIITTGVDADTIVAGGGDDFIYVRGGADTVDSGAGNDTLVVDYAAFDTNVTGGVTGGNLGTGHTGAIADEMGSSVSFTTTENVHITTGSGNDSIDTGEGVDFLDGGAGDDTLNAGAGNDRLYGRTGNDRLYGEDGHDLIHAGDGRDVLDGGAGHDRLFGEDGNDVMSGGDGGDRLYGANGNDVGYGGLMGDFLNGGDGHDRLFGEEGDDGLYGAEGNDILYGGANNDILNGGAGHDRLFGGDGTDRQYGDVGDDIIDGGAGNDLIYSGAGVDTLTGGAGADRFIFRPDELGGSSLLGTITDFDDTQDFIDLRSIDADPNTAGNQAFTWASGGFTGAAGEAFLSYDAGTGLTTLALDIDGDGVADYEIQLVGNVSESDHFLI